MLILTAFSQRDLIEQARNAGALAYLVKPFQKSELLPAIEMAIGRFAEMKALDEQVKSLEESLEVRKAIDRAKGILMDELGWKESESFNWIRSQAMHERMRMLDVANQIIGGLRPTERPQSLTPGGPGVRFRGRPAEVSTGRRSRSACCRSVGLSTGTGGGDAVVFRAGSACTAARHVAIGS